MIWLLMFVGFCIYMAVKTSVAGGFIDGGLGL